VVFGIISAYFVHLCIFLISPGTLSIIVILFSNLLTVRILNLLGNVFEIIKCIFAISAVLGSFVFGIILDCIGTFADCNF
jgi:hypothetical protein